MSSPSVSPSSSVVGDGTITTIQKEDDCTIEDKTKCTPTCGPYGKCCYQEEQEQWLCHCGLTYTGKDCSFRMEQCMGPFVDQQQQGGNNNNSNNNNDVENDIENSSNSVAVCYNGGTCVVDSTATNNYNNDNSDNNLVYYRCNCMSSVAAAPGDGGGGGAAVVGKQCEYRAEISCELSNPYSTYAFCVNGGTCRYMVLPDQDHIPCQCDSTKYEGRHCQYIIGMAPPEEIEYVSEKLIEYNNKNNLEEQSSPSGKQIFATIVLVVIILSTIGCCINTIYQRWYQHRMELLKDTTNDIDFQVNDYQEDVVETNGPHDDDNDDDDDDNLNDCDDDDDIRNHNHNRNDTTYNEYNENNQDYHDKNSRSNNHNNNDNENNDDHQHNYNENDNKLDEKMLNEIL